ncbi:rhomboid family intramembrane serine protease [Clostridium akagii]|uniref:rhomboid family intramembrane serine protease n=1 Tax=Clostridium akagii TaxID=91623 RepID=UPI00047D447A|nr:rhomboid family intramembrane serine protease [Clostridium akagii]
MDKNTRSLIESICRNNNYQITELKCGSDYLWGVINSEMFPKKLFIFFENNKRKQLDLVVNDLEINHKDSIDYIKVLVTKSNADVNLNENRLIALNVKKNKILYISSDMDGRSREIETIINSRVSYENQSDYLFTYIIIGINIVVFLISAYLSGNIFNIDSNVLISMGAKENSLISNGEYYRLLTSEFLHAGIVHITMNMYSLYIVGKLVEKIYGKSRYIVIYIVSAIGASTLSYLFSNSMSIGASGAIFGIMGATLVMAYKLRDRIGKGFLKNVIAVIVINLIFSVSVPNIDLFAHLGGFISGTILSWLLYKEKLAN